MAKVKTKDNPPSLPSSQTFRQSKKAMVDEESHKTKVKKLKTGGSQDCKLRRSRNPESEATRELQDKS